MNPPTHLAATLLWKRGYASLPSTMRSWQVAKFGDELKLREVRLPVISKPDQVLIRVKAASVNPIDTAMVSGYGDTLLTEWRRFNQWDCKETRLPFTPGRDFSGVIEAVGGAVTSLKTGDEVMGVMPAMDPCGSHAEFAITSASYVTRKPSEVSHIEAAACPYVACTAWSTFLLSRINQSNAKENRILIHGGAGGVGSTAIQFLRAWGARKIVATCSADSFELVSSLGAHPVDYSSATVVDELIDNGPYEVVIDCVGSDLAQWSDKIMGTWRNCVHVSIVSPMLQDIDRYGLPAGLASTAVKYFVRSAQSALEGKWFTYAYFMPNKECLDTLAAHLRDKKMKAIVQRVVPFEDVAKAYTLVAEKHGRGKTVVSIDGQTKPQA